MKFFLLISITFLFHTLGFAQTKIGYVNPDEILGQMKEMKKVDSVLAIFSNELNADYEQKNNELDKTTAAFYKDSMKMTPTIKAAKKILIQNKFTELMKVKENYNQLVNDEYQRLLTPVSQKLFKTIQDVAKENNYTIVLNAATAIDLQNGNNINQLIKKKLGL